MSLNVLMCSERRISVVMVLVFLPWSAVVLLAAGSWAALNFLGHTILAFAAAYGITSVALPTPAEFKSSSCPYGWHPGDLGSDGVLAEAGASPYLGLSSRRVYGIWKNRANCCTPEPTSSSYIRVCAAVQSSPQDTHRRRTT